VKTAFPAAGYLRTDASGVVAFALTAHSCGGSCGLGLAGGRTAFPFHRCLQRTGGRPAFSRALPARASRGAPAILKSGFSATGHVRFARKSWMTLRHPLNHWQITRFSPTLGGESC